MINFSTWFNENKDSEELLVDYNNYLIDNESTGEKPLTFRQFAKQIYNSGELAGDD